MAIGVGCLALRHTASWFTCARRSTEQLGIISPCHGSRKLFAAIDFHGLAQQVANQMVTTAGSSYFAPVRKPSNQHFAKIVPRGGRSLLYENAMSYVLIEPGEDELFVTRDELLARLKSWLVKWPAKELPKDLQNIGSVDEIVVHLVDSACELDLGGGLGSLQWFEVRLES